MKCNVARILQFHMASMLITDKIGKVNSLEYTNISKAIFTPHHLCRCSTNVVRVNCCSLGHSCTVSPNHFFWRMFFHHWPKVVFALTWSEVHSCPTVELNHADGQTGRHDQPIRCSLTLGREDGQVCNGVMWRLIQSLTKIGWWMSVIIFVIDSRTDRVICFIGFQIRS